MRVPFGENATLDIDKVQATNLAPVTMQKDGSIELGLGQGFYYACSKDGGAGLYKKDKKGNPVSLTDAEVGRASDLAVNLVKKGKDNGSIRMSGLARFASNERIAKEVRNTIVKSNNARRQREVNAGAKNKVSSVEAPKVSKMLETEQDTIGSSTLLSALAQAGNIYDDASQLDVSRDANNTGRV